LGRLEQGRFLKITGRIKELIIGAGGENIAPVPIEEKFKTICTACSNIMMVGE
jgi:long-chain-fatty-acid--CoA ligase ACSBG